MVEPVPARPSLGNHWPEHALDAGFHQIAQARYRVGDGLQQDVLLAQRELRLNGTRSRAQAALSALVDRPAIARQSHEVSRQEFAYDDALRVIQAAVSAPQADYGAARAGQAARNRNDSVGPADPCVNVGRIPCE